VRVVTIAVPKDVVVIVVPGHARLSDAILRVQPARRAGMGEGRETS
jgi:hypothetical protein